MADEDRKRTPMKRFVIVLLWLTTLGVIAAVLLQPPYPRINERSGITKQMDNARDLFGFLRFYATEHNGRYPRSLDDLVKEGIVEEAHLARLRSYTLGVDHKSRDWVVSSDVTDSDPGDLPVVIAPVPDEHGRFIICMNDRRLVMVQKEDYDAVLRRLQEFRAKHK